MELNQDEGVEVQDRYNNSLTHARNCKHFTLYFNCLYCLVGSCQFIASIRRMVSISAGSTEMDGKVLKQRRALSMWFASSRCTFWRTLMLLRSKLTTEIKVPGSSAIRRLCVQRGQLHSSE